MGKGINLGLESIVQNKTLNEKGFFWVTLSKMHNCQVALQTKGNKIVRIICNDSRVYDTVATLKQAKSVITEHGATEGLMAVFNNGNQLGNALAIQIPEITAINQRAVGEMCCEGIDSLVAGAYDKVCEFFEDLVATVSDYLGKLAETSVCQKATLEGLVSDVLENIENIDAAEFAQEEVFGYTQPVFMERVKALDFINEHFMALSNNEESVKQLEPALKILGYVVEEKVAIVEESPAEAIADAPPAAEVMSPPVDEEVAEADVQTKSNEELEVEEQREEEIPVDGPADAPQEQELAVFRWTPANLKEAIVSLIGVLGKSDNVNKVKELLCSCKESACTDIEKIGTLEGDALSQAGENIECCRKFAAMLGTVAQLYGKSISDMVDQCVVMCGKLKKAEVPADDKDATPVEDITVAEPLGDRRKKKAGKKGGNKNEFQSDVTDNEFDPDKQDADPAGALEEGTEGPVGGDAAPASTNRRTNRNDAGGDVTDNEFDPDKQGADPAGALEEDPKGDAGKKDETDPAGALEEDPKGNANRRHNKNEEGIVIEQPIVPPTNPEAAPGVVPDPVTPPVEPAAPVTPVNPDGSPIEESPLVPPQPATTNEQGVETPEGLPGGEAAPKPVEEPAPGVDPNGNPDVPSAVTEPHTEPVETPPETIPDTSAEKALEAQRFNWF